MRQESAVKVPHLLFAAATCSFYLQLQPAPSTLHAAAATQRRCPRHSRGQLTTFKTVPHDTHDTPSVHSTVVQLSCTQPSNAELPSGALLSLRVPTNSLHMCVHLHAMQCPPKSFAPLTLHMQGEHGRHQRLQRGARPRRPCPFGASPAPNPPLSSLTPCTSHTRAPSPPPHLMFLIVCFRSIGSDPTASSPLASSCSAILSCALPLLHHTSTQCSPPFPVSAAKRPPAPAPTSVPACIQFSTFSRATRSGLALSATGCGVCCGRELLPAAVSLSLTRLQVDLNLFKMQREQADPISSADASIVHTLNADVRSVWLCIVCVFFRFCVSLIVAVSGFIRHACHIQRQRFRARGGACGGVPRAHAGHRVSLIALAPCVVDCMVQHRVSLIAWCSTVCR